MKLKIGLLFSIIFVVLWGSSCRKDFEYADSSGHLSFSKDTVFLDTIFSGLGSSTYSFKVYNTTKDDVIIPSITLRNGNDSYYRLNVDGKAGIEFKDIPLYAEDSLFVFIETNVSIGPNENTQLLYTDAIQFDENVYRQEVELITLIKDAIFLYPNKNIDGATESINLYTQEDGTEVMVQGFALGDDQLHFNNTKPYVIYGYASIPENKQLIIDAGARIHFHAGSGLHVQPNATLQINGSLSTDQEVLEGEVILEGDRLEPEFSSAPGQWNGIFFSNGSINNSIEHLTVKNAQIGIYVEGDIETETTTLSISNSQLYNSSIHNLWSKSANIIAQNVVLGSSGSASLKCELGGRLDFTHSTIANYWTNGFRSGRALELSNYGGSEMDSGTDLIQANFRNSIVDGNSMQELRLSSNNVNAFNYSFQNCFIKFKQSDSESTDDTLYDFGGSAFENSILNVNPDYFEPTTDDYRIGLTSDLINRGSTSIAQEVPFDILNIERTSSPDLGAYRATAKEE